MQIGGALFSFQARPKLAVYKYANANKARSPMRQALGSADHERSYFAVALYKAEKAVIISGGNRNDDYTLDSVLKFSLVDNTFTTVDAFMRVARQNHSSSTAGGKLYVVAGYDGNRELDSIEYLDLQNPYAQWHMIRTPSLTPRKDPCVVGLASNQLLICGGKGKDGKHLSDVLTLDTETNKITQTINAPFAFCSTGHNQSYPVSFDASDDSEVISLVYTKNSRVLLKINTDKKSFDTIAEHKFG